MTFILVLMLGAGALLIVSAIECTSLVQVTQDVWSGKVAGYTWQCQSAAGGIAANPTSPNAPGAPGKPGMPADPGGTGQPPITFAGPGASQASRLTPWVQNGWRG